MAKIFRTEIFRGLFTKKTCIFLPSNTQAALWESTCSFGKELFVTQGKLSVCAGEIKNNSEYLEEPAINKCECICDCKPIEQYEIGRKNKRDIHPSVQQKMYEYMKRETRTVAPGRGYKMSKKDNQNRKIEAQETKLNVNNSGKNVTTVKKMEFDERVADNKDMVENTGTLNSNKISTVSGTLPKVDGKGNDRNVFQKSGDIERSNQNVRTAKTKSNDQTRNRSTDRKEKEDSPKADREQTNERISGERGGKGNGDQKKNPQTVPTRNKAENRLKSGTMDAPKLDSASDSEIVGNEIIRVRNQSQILDEIKNKGNDKLTSDTTEVLKNYGQKGKQMIDVPDVKAAKLEARSPNKRYEHQPTPASNNTPKQYSLNDSHSSKLANDHNIRITAPSETTSPVDSGLAYDDCRQFQGQISSDSASQDHSSSTRIVFGSAFDDVRSSFPSSCNEKYLVFDERQKTRDFGSQCNDFCFLEDDHLSHADKLTRQNNQCDGCGVYVLKIRTGYGTTGRHNSRPLAMNC